MHTRSLLPSALLLSLSLASGLAFAQASAKPGATAAPATSASSPAKKELVAKLLKLQQPSIEALARNLTEQPAAQMLSQASLFLQARVAPEKREAVAKEIGNDVKAYTSEAVPLVRDRAIKLAPTTAGKVLEERMSEEELKQVIAMLESPVYAKYMQLSGDLQKALVEKLVADTRPTIDPKLKSLEASIGKRLSAAAGQAAAAPAPAAPAK